MHRCIQPRPRSLQLMVRRHQQVSIHHLHALYIFLLHHLLILHHHMVLPRLILHHIILLLQNIIILLLLNIILPIPFPLLRYTAHFLLSNIHPTRHFRLLKLPKRMSKTTRRKRRRIARKRKSCLPLTPFGAKISEVRSRKGTQKQSLKKSPTFWVPSGRMSLLKRRSLTKRGTRPRRKLIC